MTNAPIRVLVVDDHFLPRFAVKALLGDEADMQIVGEAQNGWQAVELFKQHRPDVVLMDLRLPEMDGVSAMTAVMREDPEARILVLSHYDSEVDIKRALEAGARGYLRKDTNGEILIEAIRAIASGKRYIPSEIAEKAAEPEARSSLTKRELHILTLIFKGMSNQEIANELEITEGTVRIHVSNILIKLGVKRRTEAVAVALKRGILRPE
jgi:DNA-binding NarL/FixJ family response regulator